MRLQKYELENERKGIQAKECRQLLETGKEKKTNYPMKAKKKQNLLNT